MARAGKVLRELVSDVAGVEIREYQHVGAPRHGAFGLDLHLCNGIDESCVGLQLAVDRESRVACSSNLKRAYDLLRAGVARAALRRETKAARRAALPRAARGSSPPKQARCRRAARRRLGVDRAIGIDQNPFVQDHQEEARRRADAFCEPNRHQPSLDHAGRRMRDAGEHRVGIARLDHHAGMQQRFAHRALGDPDCRRARHTRRAAGSTADRAAGWARPAPRLSACAQPRRCVRHRLRQHDAARRGEPAGIAFQEHPREGRRTRSYGVFGVL